MKVILELPDQTAALMLSYLTREGGHMSMCLRNVTTRELFSGEPIQVTPQIEDPEGAGQE